MSISSILLSFVLGAAPAPGEAACVTNLAGFAKLVRADYAARRPFLVAGTVVADNPWAISVGDKTRHLMVECPDGMLHDAAVGDAVQIAGHLVIDGEGRKTHVADTINVLRRGAEPPLVSIDAKDLQSDRFRFSRASLSGIVTSVRRDEFDPMYNWLVFRTKEDAFCAAALERQHPLEGLRGLVDCEVSIQGVVMPFADFRMSRGAFLMVYEPHALRVLRQAAGSHFDVPALSGRRNELRQRVAGTVVASCANRFFIRNDDHGCLAVYPYDASTVPRPGSEVVAAGYATDGLLGLQIGDALVQTTSAAPHALPPPDADLASLPANVQDPDKTALEFHGRIVRVAGTVLPTADDAIDAGRASVDSGGRRHHIDVSGLPRAAQELLRPSATVEVTGLCVAEYEMRSPTTNFCRFRCFTVIPRSQADIKVLKSPPWWTIGRLTAAILVLLVALAAILVWNRMLRMLSERRGRQLYREQIERERASLKVEERTRLAIELHDSISQTLTGVALQLESASRANSGGNAAVEKFLQVGTWMLDSCRRELKSCLWDLHRRTFDEKDMTEAIIRSIEPHSGNAKVNVRFNVARRLLSEPVTHMILRIIRELVSNSVRHGHAAHVQVAGEFRDGLIRFSVRDDGVGFDVSRTPGPSQGHFGLLGIRERLRRHGGDITVESSIGKGTKTTVALPAEGLEGHEK